MTQGRRGWDFSKWVVAGMLCANLVFTSVVLYIFFTRGVEPTTLIQAWYGLLGAELGILGWIKTRKIYRNL